MQNAQIIKFHLVQSVEKRKTYCKTCNGIVK